MSAHMLGIDERRNLLVAQQPANLLAHPMSVDQHTTLSAPGIMKGPTPLEYAGIANMHYPLGAEPPAWGPGVVPSTLRDAGPRVRYVTYISVPEYSPLVLGGGGICPAENIGDATSVKWETIQVNPHLPQRRANRGPVAYGTLSRSMQAIALSQIGTGLEFVIQDLLGPDGPGILRMALFGLALGIAQHFLMAAFGLIVEEARSKNPANGLYSRGSVMYTGVTLEALAMQSSALFGIVQKSPDPLQRIMQYVRDLVGSQQEGSQPDTLFMPPDAASYVKMREERLRPIYGGNPDSARIPRIEDAVRDDVAGFTLVAVKSRSVNGVTAFEFFDSEVQIAEFVCMAGEEENPERAPSVVYMYDQRTDDREQPVSVVDALLHCERFDAATGALKDLSDPGAWPREYAPIEGLSYPTKDPKENVHAYYAKGYLDAFVNPENGANAGDLFDMYKHGNLPKSYFRDFTAIGAARGAGRAPMSNDMLVAIVLSKVREQLQRVKDQLNALRRNWRLATDANPRAVMTATQLTQTQQLREDFVVQRANLRSTAQATALSVGQTVGVDVTAAAFVDAVENLYRDADAAAGNLLGEIDIALRATPPAYPAASAPGDFRQTLIQSRLADPGRVFGDWTLTSSGELKLDTSRNPAPAIVQQGLVVVDRNNIATTKSPSMPNAIDLVGMHYNMTSQDADHQQSMQHIAGAFNDIVKPDSGEKHEIDERIGSFIARLKAAGVLPQRFMDGDYAPQTRAAETRAALEQMMPIGAILSPGNLSEDERRRRGLALTDPFAVDYGVADPLVASIGRLTRANFIAMAEAGQPLPFNIFLLRTNGLLRSCGATTAASGMQRVYWSLPVATWGQNSQEQVVQLTCSLRIGATFLPDGKAAVIHLPDVFIRGVVSGFDLDFKTQQNPRGSLIVFLEPLNSPLNKNSSFFTLFGTLANVPRFREAGGELNAPTKDNWTFMSYHYLQAQYGLGRQPTQAEAEMGMVSSGVVTVHPDVVYRGASWHPNSRTGKKDKRPMAGPLAGFACLKPDWPLGMSEVFNSTYLSQSGAPRQHMLMAK